MSFLRYGMLALALIVAVTTVAQTGLKQPQPICKFWPTG